MTVKPKLRRGMTMAEILICVAVVAIAVVMVVSFSVMMGDRMERSRAQLEAREELEMLESITRAWLNVILTGDAATEFAVTEPDADNPEWGKKLTVKLGNAPGEGETDTRSVCTLAFAYNGFSGTRPGDEPIRVRTEWVTGAEFFVMENESTGDALFYCAVEYAIPMAGSNQLQKMRHVFCVNPHVGESA